MAATIVEGIQMARSRGLSWAALSIEAAPAVAVRTSTSARIT